MLETQKFVRKSRIMAQIRSGCSMKAVVLFVNCLCEIGLNYRPDTQISSVRSFQGQDCTLIRRKDTSQPERKRPQICCSNVTQLVQIRKVTRLDQVSSVWGLGKTITSSDQG